jgi:hypothetical protein
MLRSATFVIGLSCISTAYAQLATSTALVGNVNDTAGAAMSGVAIIALNTATQETLSALTNSEGYYAIPFVKPGDYRITASQPGFEQVMKTGVHVDTNQTARTDFTLKVGQVNEQVTVSAAPPPIATEDARVSETIGIRTTESLPLNGRDPLKLATITPGVLPGLKTPAGNPGGGEGFVGAGVREIQNSVSLDGVSIMNNLITTTTFRPSVDAVQETQIQTGTYPAEYGGYMGLQMNLVTKGGTNTLHGAAFEFLRNNKLDARGFFEDSRLPQAPFHQNQFGGELAGPVVLPHLYNGRNRTFFMASYEGQRTRQATAQLDTVLTANMRQGDFSELLPGTTLKNPFADGAPFAGNAIPQSLLSTQAQKALQYLPLANAAGLSRNYNSNVPYTNTTDQTLDRIDQSFGEKTRLFFRYAWENTTLLNGNTNPWNGYNQPVTDRNFVVGWTQVISPTLINDARFGRQHTTIDSVNFFNTPALANAGTELGIPGFTTDLSNSGLPVFSPTGYLAIGGQNMASSNWYQMDTTWQATDVVSLNRGAHGITAGFEIRKLITNRTANNAPRGQFTFSGQFSGNGAADLILGIPNQVTTPGPLFPGGAAEYRNGFFFSDKWQISRKLTLTLGLRYELTTVPESTTGNATILDPSQTMFIPTQVPQKIPLNNPNHKDFAPRVGLAYRATEKWVLRGGWGLYYNPNQLNTYTLLTTNPPFSTIYTYTSDANTPTLSLANSTPAAAQGATPKPNAVSPNPHLPTARMSQWSLDVQRALWKSAGLDVQYLGSRSWHLDRSFYNNTPQPGPGNVDARRPNQNFRSIRIIQNDEIASYNALNVILRQQLFHGLTLLTSYTWSHALDISTDSNGGGAPMNPWCWRCDYGNANWDVRHRFVVSYSYDLPFFRSSANKPLQWVLGNWQLNGITTSQTGFPFNTVVPGDPANTGVGNQRPNVVGVATADCGRGHLTNCISSAAFTLPTQYTYGNAGRNLLYGPGLVNFDFSVFKSFPVRERARVQLRGEFFNLFNTPSFSNPSATFNTSAFGTISSTSNNNRQVQVAAKFLF